MIEIPDSLAALQRVSTEDQALIGGSVAAAGLCGWRAYFPYLCGLAQGGSRTLLWEVEDGAVCLYLLRTRRQVLRLDLYLAPFPFSARALRMAQDRVNEFNRSSTCEIAWVEEPQRPIIESMGFRMRERDRDYLYDAQKLRSLEGHEFARLRRCLSKARRIPDLSLRDYTASDEAVCLELLRRWRRTLLESKGIDVKSHSYMSRCVRNAFAFEGDMMRGRVALVGERLVGFCFGGRMGPTLGNLFVCVNDHDQSLLGYLMRQELFSRSQGFERFNDGSDTGREGLAYLKRAFNPVALLPHYRALPRA